MMDNQSMREMNKDELIANLSLNNLADIIIMERQHIRELRQRNDKLVEMLQEQISDQTHKLAIADRALELALEYFALLDNDIHKYKLCGAYGIFLHDDFCKAKWITKAEQEVNMNNLFKVGDKVIPSKTDINFEDYGNLGMKKALPITNINGEFIKWGGTWEHYSRFTIAEPAKFANVKVGDWVETIGGKQFKVGGWDGDYFWLEGWGCRSNAYYDKHGLNRYRDNSPQEDIWDIRRIVPPSEVEVEVTLKVKHIRRLNDNSFVCITNVKGWTFGISYDDIPQFQAEQVRALLGEK